MTYIYCLICPLDGQMKYIRKANQPSRRAKDHMFDIRGVPSDRVLWLGELRKKKLRPIVEVLDVVEVGDWKFWEEFYIGYFKSLGISLLQKRNGGNGLTFCNQQTFKKGQKPHNLGKIKMGNKYV